MKLDDDVLVNIPAIDEYLLNNKQGTKLLLFRSRNIVHCEGKLKVSVEEFVDNQYPDNVVGLLLIYSNDFVLAGLQKTFTTSFIRVNLASGMIRMQLNVKILPIYRYLASEKLLEIVLNGLATQIVCNTIVWDIVKKTKFQNSKYMKNLGIYQII